MPLLTPADPSAEALADWLELYLFAGGVDGLGAAAGRKLLADHLSASDTDAGMAINAMARRGLLLKGRYPFAINAVGVTRSTSGPSYYEALSIVACQLAPFRSTNAAFDKAVVLFEGLVSSAVKELLGPGSCSVRFGWPSEEGRPREFSAAIQWLADRMGTRLGNAYRPPRRKDGGVDVVGWRPFPDGKPGFPIMLVQCTLERDFVHKSRDIDRRIWAGWLAFDTDPLTALAIPYVVPKDEDWREMASNVIVLDRVRLASLLDEGVCPASLADWVAQQREGLHGVFA